MLLNKLNRKILFIFSYMMILPGLSASWQEINPRADSPNEGAFKQYFYRSLDYFKPIDDLGEDEFKKMQRRSSEPVENFLIVFTRFMGWSIPWVACMPRIFRGPNTLTQIEDTLVLLTFVHSGIAMTYNGLYDIEKVKGPKGTYTLGATLDIRRIFFLTASFGFLRHLVYPYIFDRASMMTYPLEVFIALCIAKKILDAADRIAQSQESRRDEFKEELEGYPD